MTPQPSAPLPAAGNLPGPRGGLRIPPGPGIVAGYLDAIGRHGEVLCTSDAPDPLQFLVSHPDHVKHVLQDNQASYRQNTRKKILMGGKSLTLSAGEPWRRRRRVMQPLFNLQRLSALAPRMVAGSERMVERWQGPAAQGTPVDVAREMADLTLELLIDSLLGTGVDRDGLRRSVTTAFDYFNARARNPKTLPVAVPTPRNLRLLKALRDLRRAVERAVAGHRESGEPAGDLLSMMLAAKDEQTGEVMESEQLLDEIMMLLVMGHMTTAMAATWTWHLLALNPDCDERMRAEIASVVGDRPAEYKDVAGLSYTRMVIEESLRLYPPSWSFSRVALADDEIGGYRIPAGSTVVLCPWVTHRRPELWPDADRFIPERFAPRSGSERPRFAYYPFGGGPRVCIARDMALMEIPLILATVARRYRLRALPGHPVVPVRAITLEPRAGLRMTLSDAAAPPRPAAPPQPFATLPELLLGNAGTGTAPAFRHKVDGEYADVPRAELWRRARRLAAALAALGVAPGERAVLCARNSPDWAVADLAALAAGAVTVPLQDDLALDDAVRFARASGARALLASGARMAELLPRRGELPEIAHWLQIDGHGPVGEGVITVRSLLEGGADADVSALVRQRRPEDPATLLYTPGTTDEPKAVELSHGNLAAAVHGLAAAVPVRAGDTGFFYLPLSRPAERSLLYLCLHRGATVAFAGSRETVDQDLRRVQPDFLSSTPELWKRVLNWLFNTVQANSPRRQKFFHWSVKAGRASLPWRLRHRRPPGRLGWQLAVADRFVFSVVRRELGGKIRFALSGTDRIPHGWITFLWAAGIPVYESYGLAEATGVVTIDTPQAVRPGTAGAPLPGIEVRISPEGEILVRGETVAPGLAAADGWLHTGDTGFLDDAGLLNVFGRTADLYAGLDGKRVSPAGLESFARSSHFVLQALVVGEGRPFNAALLFPDLPALRRLAKRRGIAYSSLEELVCDQRVSRLLENDFASFNEKLAPHDKIKTWELYPGELTVAAGEITPAGTLRRAVVMERYAAAIEGMYRK
ncbi:MAG TPA: cytochrome P450 [Thermoanaerobaculia bacterium]|nr:cytochrome P450 [Thermoanaerobaculia bacterium]